MRVSPGPLFLPVQRAGALHRLVVVVGGRMMDVVVAVATDTLGINAGPFLAEIAVAFGLSVMALQIE